MPAAAFIVPAVAAIAGGVIAHKSASNATKAQQTANDSALAYQRERDAKADKRYEDNRARYLADLDAWKARRGFGGGAAGGGAPSNVGKAVGNASSAIKQLGAVPVPGAVPGAAPVPGAVPADATGAQAGPPQQGLTLRDMAAGGMPGAAPIGAPLAEVSSMPTPGQPRTLRDIAQAGEWNDWTPYLRGQA
jgi:hypothetical protein